ncbi:unnamed protein product [Linum tenue]|uniref:Uncharacterized protein n=1 Tax=Linum tenue TaxID=586396 RepID=A0AAV0J110_9ROSI|nr:unnamed protein product [Linum tenue]
MTTPPISAGNLLVASAVPGGFSTVDALCFVARSRGGEVLLLAARPETESCVHASKVFYVRRRLSPVMALGKGNRAAAVRFCRSVRVVRDDDVQVG